MMGCWGCKKINRTENRLIKTDQIKNNQIEKPKNFWGKSRRTTQAVFLFLFLKNQNPLTKNDKGEWFAFLKLSRTQNYNFFQTK